MGNIPASKFTEVDRENMPCNAAMITVGSQGRGSPVSNNGNNSESGNYFVNTLDAVPHVASTMVSSLVLAFIILVVNVNKRTPPTPPADFPSLTAFHRILFRSIISPNAP